MRGTLLAVAGVAIGAGTAAAQPQAPVQNRPAFSPYLNLLRGANNGGASPALNYYGLVRPEIQLRQQNALLQQQVTQNSQSIQGINEAAGQGVDPSLPYTGRGATFMNYSHYFPTLGGGGGSVGIGSRAGFGRGMSGMGGIGMGPTNTGITAIGRSPTAPNIGGAGRAAGGFGGVGGAAGGVRR